MALFHLLKVKCTTGFGMGIGHITHWQHTVQILNVVCQTNGQLVSKEGYCLEQDALCGCFGVEDFWEGFFFVDFGEEFALACFHKGLKGGRGLWLHYMLLH
eukprot:4125318-Ditylum_brightwellii.AAC.1